MRKYMINLTENTFMNKHNEILPSSTPVTFEAEMVTTGVYAGIPIVEKKVTFYNLPKVDELSTPILVSPDVLEHLPIEYKGKAYTPHDTIKDEDGEIIGYKSLRTI